MKGSLREHRPGVWELIVQLPHDAAGMQLAVRWEDWQRTPVTAPA